MGSVITNSLVQLIAKQVDDRGLVVWYDPEQAHGATAAVETAAYCQETCPKWLDILRRELDLFPDAAVISLGEPVLDVLLKPGVRDRMRWFWGHHPRLTHSPKRTFRLVDPDQSTLERRFYPFIHKNSDRLGFYRERRPDYQRFIRDDIEATANLSGRRQE